MKDFTRDERIMMMLYNPGTRAGLVAELEAMRLQLTPSERRLGRLSKSVLEKLEGKELTSAGHLSARDISFAEEMAPPTQPTM